MTFEYLTTETWINFISQKLNQSGEFHQYYWGLFKLQSIWFLDLGHLDLEISLTNQPRVQVMGSKIPETKNRALLDEIQNPDTVLFMGFSSISVPFLASAVPSNYGPPNGWFLLPVSQVFHTVVTVSIGLKSASRIMTSIPQFMKKIGLIWFCQDWYVGSFVWVYVGALVYWWVCVGELILVEVFKKSWSKYTTNGVQKSEWNCCLCII